MWSLAELPLELYLDEEGLTDVSNASGPMGSKSADGRPGPVKRPPSVSRRAQALLSDKRAPSLSSHGSKR